MSLANSSPRAALLGVLLLVSPTAQNLVRGQLTPAPVQTCHSFYCFGETCYQEAKFSDQMAECEPGQQHREEKACATFSCQGSECFKGQKAVAMCPKGLDFCELKRSSSGYTAGCSQTCVSRVYRCHGAMVQACSQASVLGSCLQLDGNLDFNQAAPEATRSPLSGPWLGRCCCSSSTLPCSHSHSLGWPS